MIRFLLTCAAVGLHLTAVSAYAASVIVAVGVEKLSQGDASRRLHGKKAAYHEQDEA